MFLSILAVFHFHIIVYWNIFELYRIASATGCVHDVIFVIRLIRMEADQDKLLRKQHTAYTHISHLFFSEIPVTYVPQLSLHSNVGPVFHLSMSFSRQYYITAVWYWTTSWWRIDMKKLPALLAISDSLTCEFTLQKASDTELWCILSC